MNKEEYDAMMSKLNSMDGSIGCLTFMVALVLLGMIFS